jgi:hypothetical protein
MRVLILQIFAGLIAWLFAGLGVAMLFKTRLIGFHVPEDPALDVSPVVSRALTARTRR